MYVRRWADSTGAVCTLLTNAAGQCYTMQLDAVLLSLNNDLQQRRVAGDCSVAIPGIVYSASAFEHPGGEASGEIRPQAKSWWINHIDSNT